MSKPILFSTAMIQAILEGRKTQTRRVMRPQPVYENDCWFYGDDVFFSEGQMQDHLFHNVYGNGGSPYGSVYNSGEPDTLWVRETWAVNSIWDSTKPSDLPVNGTGIYYFDDNFGEYKKRPSIFMPRWASRITLKVTDIRVERVQDISEEDARAEGVSHLPDNEQGIWGACHRFILLWDSINARRGYSWASNPWVWVVEFEVMK